MHTNKKQRSQFLFVLFFKKRLSFQVLLSSAKTSFVPPPLHFCPLTHLTIGDLWTVSFITVVRIYWDDSLCSAQGCKLDASMKKRASYSTFRPVIYKSTLTLNSFKFALCYCINTWQNFIKILNAENCYLDNFPWLYKYFL